MNREDILKKVDHTLLAQGATWEEIKVICDDAIKYGTASVCIPASYVKQVAEYFDNVSEITPAVCTVIGFPNGYSTTATKVFETEDAINNGADEIDMVINIGWAKAGLWDRLEEEIRDIKKACGDKILKVIIETCLLTDAEKIEMCKVVTKAGADYIKTSTGFAGGGATFEDVKLFKENVGPDIKIKAAGGIRTRSELESYINEGCDRIGTSSAIDILKG